MLWSFYMSNNMNQESSEQNWNELLNLNSDQLLQVKNGPDPTITRVQPGFFGRIFS